jgi:hypothetical protein
LHIAGFLQYFAKANKFINPQTIISMKHRGLFFISALVISSITVEVYANNPVKESSRDTTSLNQTASKMVERWTRDVQLTKAQQTQLMEKTIIYLKKRQEILDKTEPDTEGRIKYTDKQKASMQKVSDTYRNAIESILTDVQKLTVEVKSEERNNAIKEMVQEEAKKEAESKGKKNH